MQREKNKHVDMLKRHAKSPKLCTGQYKGYPPQIRAEVVQGGISGRVVTGSRLAPGSRCGREESKVCDWKQLKSISSQVLSCFDFGEADIREPLRIDVCNRILS